MEGQERKGSGRPDGRWLDKVKDDIHGSNLTFLITCPEGQ